jgi:DNA invertase Pin-like site-specific DNA recombinase
MVSARKHPMKKRVAIYLRVSTSKQDTENQLRELSAVADRSGWEIWKVYEDACISGAKGRDKRRGLDAMMKAVNANEFDMVATWSVDRLGRSLTDLLAYSRASMKRGRPVPSPARPR